MTDKLEVTEIVRVNDLCAAPWSYFSTIEIKRKEESQTKDLIHLHWEEQQSYSTQKLFSKGEQTSHTRPTFLCTNLLHIPPISFWLNNMSMFPLVYCMHIHKCLFLSDVVACACGQKTENQSCTNPYLSIQSWVTAGPRGSELEKLHMNLSDAPAHCLIGWPGVMQCYWTQEI